MKIRNILWGILFIFVGVIFGLNALEITNIDIFFDGWWTLFIIVPCFISLFKESDKTGSLIGILIGIALLLACQGILSFELIWKLMIPIILIIIGCSFIFKDAFKTKVNEKIKTLKTNENTCYATFSSQNLKYEQENFKGCELNAIFGEITCDLREAKISKDVVITASSIFGGITIYAPNDIKIKVKSTSIFGGVNNKYQNKKEDKTITIYVDATCIFGGIDIK